MREMTLAEIDAVFARNGIAGCEPGNAFHATPVAHRLAALEQVVEAGMRILPYLPDMPPTHGARAHSGHAQASHAFRTALAALDEKGGR